MSKWETAEEQKHQTDIEIFEGAQSGANHSKRPSITLDPEQQELVRLLEARRKFRESNDEAGTP